MVPEPVTWASSGERAAAEASSVDAADAGDYAAEPAVNGPS